MWRHNSLKDYQHWLLSRYWLRIKDRVKLLFYHQLLLDNSLLKEESRLYRVVLKPLCGKVQNTEHNFKVKHHSRIRVQLHKRVRVLGLLQNRVQKQINLGRIMGLYNIQVLRHRRLRQKLHSEYSKNNTRKRKLLKYRKHLLNHKCIRSLVKHNLRNNRHYLMVLWVL